MTVIATPTPDVPDHDAVLRMIEAMSPDERWHMLQLLPYAVSGTAYPTARLVRTGDTFTVVCPRCEAMTDEPVVIDGDAGRESRATITYAPGAAGREARAETGDAEFTLIGWVCEDCRQPYGMPEDVEIEWGH